ncbi:MAG: DUF4230 domain-containing protein [Bacteroidota bacterium]
MRKLGTAVIAISLVALLGIQIYQLLRGGQEETTQVETAVLLEQIREVCKLVTVEGEFSELYTEKNLREVTLYLPIPTYWEFSKEAIIEVRGKVLVGYDMEQLSIKIDSTNRTVTFNNLPEPDILAIDHEVRYRNLEESFFNSFSPEDYTQLNKNAKEALRKKAYESELLPKARAEGNTMLEGLHFMMENMGWRLQYETPATLPNTESTGVAG